MEKIAIIIYSKIFVPIFWCLLKIFSVFNDKIKRGIKGRVDLFNQLEQDVKKLTAKNRIWFHSSSMGEFEQAKPIISALRASIKDLNIIVTFFSPSGYEHSKNYKFADIVTYIPFDTKKNAEKFVDLINPTLAIFVRYDVWPNHLWKLNSKNIPVFIANATMRKNSKRFLPLLKQFHYYIYNCFNAIFTVSENDLNNFAKFKLDKPFIKAIGETRYDQVWQRSADAKTKHIIPDTIVKNKKIFIAGSSWPEDEAVFMPAIKKIMESNSNVLSIIVPHEPTEEAIEDIEHYFQQSKIKSIRFSLLNDYAKEQIIIVDSIGILMVLYKYAHIAYVGGSFKQGIHNVLEPAVYGIPVIFGPKNTNSQESQELKKRGGAFEIKNQDECYNVMYDMFMHKKNNAMAGKESLKLVQENVGATDRFLNHIKKYFIR